MEIRLAELRLKNPQAQLKQQWVPYERISIHLKRAIIAAEDAKFVDHEGFDWEGMQKALEKNQKKGRFVAGGSTISQQLAKNLFLTPTKSYFRKVEEAIITLMLENLWSKRRIFEVYLNVIEWGNGVFGAEAAARHYYNSNAAQLGVPSESGLNRRLLAAASLDRWMEAWEKVAHLLSRADAVNLDRKQTVLGSFLALQTAMR